jgi:hypothetical protein
MTMSTANTHPLEIKTSYPGRESLTNKDDKKFYRKYRQQSGKKARTLQRDIQQLQLCSTSVRSGKLK